MIYRNLPTVRKLTNIKAVAITENIFQGAIGLDSASFAATLSQIPGMAMNPSGMSLVPQDAMEYVNPQLQQVCAAKLRAKLTSQTTILCCNCGVPIAPNPAVNSTLWHW